MYVKEYKKILNMFSTMNCINYWVIKKVLRYAFAAKMLKRLNDIGNYQQICYKIRKSFYERTLKKTNFYTKLSRKNVAFLDSNIIKIPENFLNDLIFLCVKCM